MQSAVVLSTPMSLLSEPPLRDASLLSYATPVVVGGIGGSGTRVLAQLMQLFGFDFGNDLNPSLDELGFTALFKRRELWPLADHTPELEEALRIYLFSRGQSLSPNPSDEDHAQRVDALFDQLEKRNSWREHGALRDRLQFLKRSIPSHERWGWKEPNSHIVLPYLLEAMPNMKYVHVVRDGRDMAFSPNKSQLKLWGDLLLDREAEADNAQDRFDFWAATHRRILNLCMAYPGRMLLVSVEALAREPTHHISNLLDFLTVRVDTHTISRAIEIPRQVKTFGRHAGQVPLYIDASAADLLAKLGYST